MLNNIIGTLSEKSIHSKLKDYLEPNKEYQEVSVGNYIADIKRDNKIIEIQTKDFKKLVPKLNYYIQHNFDITVVYPIIKTKYINWIEVDTNNKVERRKSTHRGVIQDCFKELYWIEEYIAKEQIKFKIILLNGEQYKYLDGYGVNNKRKATKIDIVPTDILEEIDFTCVQDFIKFIPIQLPRAWTAKDFVKYSGMQTRYYSTGLKILRKYELISIVAKQGKAYVYSRVK